jgi:biopolymer transport protein ExbB
MTEHLQPLAAFFAHAGPLIWVILALSVLMWTLIVERYGYLFLALPRLRAALLAEWRALGAPGGSRGARLREGLVAALEGRLRVSLDTIRALTAILPLLGLLGTVGGMIKVFEVINTFGMGNPRGMAAGISEALITTLAGLVTGLSGLYFEVNLEGRVHEASHRFAELLTAAYVPTDRAS